jgi:hypothetical protein
MIKKVLFIILFIGYAFLSNSIANVSVTNVTLGVDTISLSVGSNYFFYANVSPSDATDPSIIWTISDNTIVGNDTSTVLALKPGVVTLLATSKSNSTVFAKVVVMVNYEPLQKISLYSSSMTIEESFTNQINVYYSPTNASNKAMQWKSSDPTIAKVDSYGFVTGLNIGNVQLEGTSIENPSLIVTLLVTVVPYQTQYQDLYLERCLGQGYKGYFENATFLDTLKTLAGTDSVIVFTHLNIQSSIDANAIVYVYSGDSILLGNSYYHLNDTAKVAYKTKFGCDSITHYQIAEKYHDSLYTNIYINKCFGETYNNHTVSADFVEKHISTNGTDSLVLVHLFILPSNESFRTIEIEKGDSIKIGNNYYNSPATVILNATTQLGCDSIVHVSVKYVSDTITRYIYVQLCQSESYNGHSIQGTYGDWFKTKLGRDSVVIATIEVLQLQSSDVSISLISGDSLYIGNSYINQPGDFTYTAHNWLGCDSIVRYHITQKIIGDNNGNGIIDDNEIAGDINKNGIIDNGEIAGDTNGDYKISGNEIAGDVNGNGLIDNIETLIKAGIRNEICGDKSGDGLISGTEICGDKNGDGIIQVAVEVIGDLNGDALINNSETIGDINGNGIVEIGEQTFSSVATKSNIKMYPNPVNNTLFIELGSKLVSGKIEITNILGSTIREITFCSQNQIAVNVQSLPAGLYIVKVNAGGIVYSQKIIKE